jgi:chromosome segregation ATPase
MRRTLFTSLGVLEFLAALVLLAFAWQLPGPRQVQDAADKMERVSRQAGVQVSRLRDEVGVLRQRRPQLAALSKQLQKQLRIVTINVRTGQIDYGAVRTVGHALGDVAQGLDGLAATLDPRGVAQIGAGMKATADYLEDKVAPEAEKAADRLEKTTEALRADAVRLGALLRAAPLDLRAARATADSLATFDEGLTRLARALKVENADAIRDGFKGLETSLSTGAGQVERLTGYTYPAITVNGFKVNVEQKEFWPEGKTIATGMRRAARGLTAAGKQLDGLNKELPRLRASLEGSRKVVTATRQALVTALKQQEKVEPLLRSVPTHAARLAHELPRLAGDLAKVLRETARLKEVAALLRQAQKGVDTATERWPELRRNLGRSSVLLRATQKQLREALDRRTEYEAAARQTLLLTETFAAALPLLTEQLDEHLEQQERSLAELTDSIDQVSTALPVAAGTASRLLVTTRLLLGLVALIVAVHGAYVLLGERLGARPVG